LREISGGRGLGAQDALEAEFGFGDATNIDLVQIEWPSGITQRITHVMSKQIITIKEPPRVSASVSSEGAIIVSARTSRNKAAMVQTSVDLSQWNDSFSVTNLADSVAITNQPALEKVFFRVVEP